MGQLFTDQLTNKERQQNFIIFPGENLQGLHSEQVDISFEVEGLNYFLLFFVISAYWFGKDKI